MPAVDLPQPLSPTRPRVSPCADVEGDAVDRVHLPDGALQQPLLDREMLDQPPDREERDRRRRRGCVHAAAATRSAWKQAAKWPGSFSSKPGISRRQMSVAKAQRAANGQPAIVSRNDGTVPGISASRGACAGRERGAEPRHRIEQALGVGMQRAAEQRADRRFLGLAAGIHDDDALRHLGDDAQIVGDQHDRGVDLVLQFAHQIEDLRLDRHVERGCRLVGDQQFRVAGERHRDHDPLAHAARQLVRILADPPLGLGDVHEAQHVDGFGERRTPRQPLMQGQGLGDLTADRQHRIERGHRLLKDHRDLVAAHPAHLGLGQPDQVAAGKADRAGDDPSRRRRDQAQDGQCGDAFAAAALADDREGFAGDHIERDAVDRANDAVAGEKPGPQIGDLQDRFDRGGLCLWDCRYIGSRGIGHARFYIRRARRGSSASRSPSPNRLMASTVADKKAPGNRTI